MATFKVELTKIEKVWNHPNADRLDLAMVEGIDLQFVVGRDSYKVGDKVVYFPIDSVLPQDLIDHLGLTGKLSGKDKNRIKTLRLRDSVSQGFVCSLETISKYFDGGLDIGYTGTDLTTLLKVTKHEPEEIPCTWGTLTALPDCVGVYDIEGVERYKEVVEMLMDVPCIITEKVEGSNFAVHIDEQDNISVCQRHHSIKESPDGEHMFWKVARNHGLIDIAKDLKSKYSVQTVTLRGEFLGGGVQGNYYELKEHKVLLFDIKVDGRYIDTEQLFDFSWNMDPQLFVPCLGCNITLREWLGGKTIIEASNGKSMLIDKLREGIVIKPMVEMRDQKLGRVILKKRSPEYLAKEK
jgi:RNA ligase (TIGR02306 family)